MHRAQLDSNRPQRRPARSRHASSPTLAASRTAHRRMPPTPAITSSTPPKNPIPIIQKIRVIRSRPGLPTPVLPAVVAKSAQQNPQRKRGHMCMRPPPGRSNGISPRPAKKSQTFILIVRSKFGKLPLDRKKGGIHAIQSSTDRGHPSRRPARPAPKPPPRAHAAAEF
jgi:hypothetical protein